MNSYTELFSNMFGCYSGTEIVVTREDLEEYKLIKNKKSKLSANDRKKIVYRVEKHLKQLQEGE